MTNELTSVACNLEAFTDAGAAVSRVQEIYNTGANTLRARLLRVDFILFAEPEVGVTVSISASLSLLFLILQYRYAYLFLLTQL